MMPTAAELIGHLRDHPHDLVEPLEDYLRAEDWSWEAVMRAILSVPESDGVRLMAARWLEENTGEVPCGYCKGQRHVTYFQGPGATNPNWKNCPACRGSGSVPDGRRDRSEFIRVQVELARPLDGCQCVGCFPLSKSADRKKCRAELRRREGELLAGPNAGFTNRTQWFTGGDRRLTTGFTPEFRRGFVEAVTCSAADWLAHHGALVWHPDQRVPCPTCENGAAMSVKEWLNSPVNPCPDCSGEGTVPRPFVPSAQPIRVVNLTTRPTDEGWYAVNRVGATKCEHTRWPGVTFTLPAAGDAAGGADRSD